MKSSLSEILAIIIARGGSKSIPRKNVIQVANQPLIAYTIQAALQAKSVGRVIVSTDSSEIADVAIQYGAEVPFLRPSELAQDQVAGIAPVIHAIEWLEKEERYLPDYIILLQPTSPLRNAEDIEAVISIANEKQADAVVSLSNVHKHPYWMKRITDEGTLCDFMSSSDTYTWRQEFPAVYAINGALYLVRRDVLLDKKTFYTDRTYPYVMPEERCLDIDTPWDLYLAELILKDKNRDENL